MHWLQKEMTVGEARSFQSSFAEEFLKQNQSRGMAAFIRTHDNGRAITILVSPVNPDLIEKLSPGGWRSSEKPQNGGWRVLAGHSDSLLWFGLPI
jgi:hypothetical protein